MSLILTRSRLLTARCCSAAAQMSGTSQVSYLRDELERLTKKIDEEEKKQKEDRDAELLAQWRQEKKDAIKQLPVAAGQSRTPAATRAQQQPRSMLTPHTHCTVHVLSFVSLRVCIAAAAAPAAGTQRCNAHIRWDPRCEAHAFV